ncbi:52 kDa repressor of the inhibitor of the protein kinase-like [Saccoglossus kowalevskii]|uniref:52 kDa repressor of the inhibitor of the protein kinase-like n=1 Tax=Saccoglossus kowalevskii TaxID=10224 RepID=A0ABM0MBW9_SACKO|nr:PREDICTED: 52 kDa repressor of the inhibitor of the protein kinase-like [Saccoglossus kowalevskii]
MADTEDTIASFFWEDLPSPDEFKQELRLWRRYWTPEKDADELPTTLSGTLKKLKVDGVEKLYPNIITIFRMVLTFSATSATVERTNSALRYVKNVYRSTMGEDRFNALVLLFVHKDIPLDYGIVIDMYARKHPRRVLIANPLSN